MRKAPMNEFSVEEYQGRIHALIGKMRRDGLDAIMLSSKENTRYFCGLQSIIWSSKVSTPGLLLVNADGEMALVGSASAAETARYTSAINDEQILWYDRNRVSGIPSTYPAAIADAFRRLGITKGKVGAEFGDSCYFQMQYHWYLDLCALLPGVTFQDASGIIFSLRSIKSPVEIQLLSDIHRQTEIAAAAAFRRISPGQTTEQEFSRLFLEEAFRGHCENAREPSVRSTPRRMSLEHCPASSEIIGKESGDILFVSGGVFTHGYHSYIERAAVTGKPSPLQEDLFQCAKDTALFACDQIRPGVDSGEVIRATNTHAARLSQANRYLSQNNLGGGLGLDPIEPPYLSKEHPPVMLQSGMVLYLSPRFGTPELGYFPCTLQIVVTDTGCRIISDPPEKLEKIPFVDRTA